MLVAGLVVEAVLGVVVAEVVAVLLTPLPVRHLCGQVLGSADIHTGSSLVPQPAQDQVPGFLVYVLVAYLSSFIDLAR